MAEKMMAEEVEDKKMEDKKMAAANSAKMNYSSSGKGWVNPYDSLTPEELLLEAIFADNEVLDPPQPEPAELLLPGNFCFRAQISGIPYCEENGTRIDFCASLLENNHEALWSAIEQGNPVQATVKQFFKIVEDEDGYWDMERLTTGRGSLQDCFIREFGDWHPLYGFETGILTSDEIAICGEALAEHLTQHLTPSSKMLTYNQFRYKLVQMSFYLIGLDTNEYASFGTMPFERAYLSYYEMFRYNMNLMEATIFKMKADKDRRISDYKNDEELAKNLVFPHMQGGVAGMRSVWEMGALVHDAQHQSWKETEKLLDEVEEAAELAEDLNDLYRRTRANRTYERGRKVKRYVYEIDSLADALSIELADIWAGLKRKGEAEKDAAEKAAEAEKNAATPQPGSVESDGAE